MQKITKLTCLFCCAVIASHSLAQTNSFPSTGSAGIGTTNPDASSLLEMISTSKGLLIPRMKKNQRDAIATPVTGLLIYQTNNNPGFYYFDGNSWKQVGNGVGANKSLGNLDDSTAISSSLLPGITNSFNLGSTTLGWKNIYAADNYFLGGNIFLSNKGGGTFTGVSAGSNNAGISNTGLGAGALNFNTTGYENTATGAYSLYNNTSGRYNTATGFASLYNNTGDFNAAIGYNSLRANKTGSYNVAAGYGALGNNSTGIFNTAVGSISLTQNDTGRYNTAVGNGSLASNIEGNFNTGIGYFADVNGDYTNSTSVGNSAATTASNQVRLGNNSITSIGGYVNWTNISDGRIKNSIRNNVPGLAFINKLKPVTYNLNLDAADNIIQRAPIKDFNGKIVQPSAEQIQSKKQKEKIIQTGFIAQEVEKAAKELNYDFSGVDAPKNDKDLYGLRYAEFVVPLVKAVQELSSLNDELVSEIKQQQKINADLQKQIDELKTMLMANSTSAKKALNSLY